MSIASSNGLLWIPAGATLKSGETAYAQLIDELYPNRPDNLDLAGIKKLNTSCCPCGENHDAPNSPVRPGGPYSPARPGAGPTAVPVITGDGNIVGHPGHNLDEIRDLIKPAVITVSDRCFQKEAEDRSGVSS